MPSEEEIKRMQEECAQIGVEEYHADAHLVDIDTSASATATSATDALNSNVGRRQTLLYSATAIHAHAGNIGGFDKKTKAAAKKLKLKGTLKGVGHNISLPDHLKQ